MSKILMFSHVPVIPKGKTFGPAMRTWGIAKALQKRGHKVTIAVKNKEKKETFQKIKIIPETSDLFNKVERYDVAFVHPWFNNSDYLKKLSKIPIITDLYAPYLIEHLYYDYDSKKDGDYRYADDIWFSTIAPLQYGDYFICASKRQKKYYLGMLAATGRLNPKNKDNDFIGIVPFGISKDFKLGKKKVLRQKIPENKKIILWMSSFYNWLDPVKTAKIMKELQDLKSDYVLAVVGAKSPFVHPTMYDKNYNDFMDFKKKKNLTNIYMFDWIDSEDIPSVYNESDLFIVTYKDSLETLLSYRVRMMNALMGKLPVISEKGDIVSEIIKKNELGLIFDNKSPKHIAEKINKLNNAKIKNIKKNIENFLPNYYWENLVGPIDDFCKKPKKDDSKELFRFSKFLDERRDLTIQLRKEIDEKEGHIKNLDKIIKEGLRDIENKNKKIDYLETIRIRKEKEQENIKEIINEKDIEINLKTLNINNKEKIIGQKDTEIDLLNRNINNLQKIISEKDKKLESNHEKIKDLTIQLDQLKGYLGRFRNSIVYPFYKITSSFGKTKLGHILQKLLK